MLLPSDTDKTPAGSSAGSAAATAVGLAALTIGVETSTDSTQIVAPTGVAGVVGLKPTVGLVSRQRELLEAQAFDLTDPATIETYETTSRPASRRTRGSSTRC